MIQRPLPDGGVRTYRITKDNAHGTGIWMDAPSEALVGAGNDWTKVQDRIGAGTCRTATPAAWKVLRCSPTTTTTVTGRRRYLFVDVIPSIGYRPMVSRDLDQGWMPLQADDYFLTAHTKHGWRRLADARRTTTVLPSMCMHSDERR